MIKFSDFFSSLAEKAVKVKFNMNEANVTKRALDNLLENEPRWIEMNAHRKKQSSNDLDKAEYLLAFAQYYPYGTDYYMFGGLYKVEKILPEVNDGIGYNLTLLPEYEAYRKRLIIKCENSVGRDTYCRWFDGVQGSKLNPEIYELAPATKLGDFPGYNNVRIMHKDLQKIFNQEAPEWKKALSIVKGVYCITDISTGKLYIGSASGKDGIWQRWSSYANVNNLTGGNKAFEDLKQKGSNYIIDNFQYSILEICDIKTKDEEVRDREGYWKKVFRSIKHGMNEN